jgi:hypothetical protein
MKALAPKDESAAYQVVVSVTDSLADDGYGSWKGEPGDGL